MNFHDRKFEKAPDTKFDASLDVEQAVIAYTLAEAVYADKVIAECSALDFVEGIHQQAWQIVANLRAEQRVPSAQLIATAIGNDEIAPGVTTETYLHNLLQRLWDGDFGTLAGAIDALKDQARRRALHGIGSRLATSSVAGRNMIGEVAEAASHDLDDVIASLRVGKSRSYDAAGAAALAIQHMDGESPSWPTTGLVDLDRMLGGWPRGQLSVLAARPAMGKSAAASCAVLKAAQSGTSVLFFSLEMIGEQLGSRLLTDLAFTRENPIFYQDILHRRIDSEYVRRRLADAQARLDGLPLRIEEQRGLSMSDIATRARKWANDCDRNGRRLDLVVVDHMLLVRPSARYAGNRTREVAEISDGLATLADEMECAVLALCQLNRAVEGKENKRPDLAHLRDSGSVEEDAATVTFLFRPEYYLAKPEDDQDLEAARKVRLEAARHKLQWIVAKNRNGETGVVESYCNIGANAIRNASKGD